MSNLKTSEKFAKEENLVFDMRLSEELNCDVVDVSPDEFVTTLSVDSLLTVPFPSLLFRMLLMIFLLEFCFILSVPSISSK